MIIFGYVDPGLGLLLWQAVISAFVGVVFYLRKTRNWILKPFKKLLRRRKDPVAPPLPPPGSAQELKK